MRTYTEEQKQKDRERKRKYLERNREKVVAMKRARYEANIDSIKVMERERFYRKAYGITIADYEAMLSAQGGVCKICGTDKTGKHKNFQVDHCHTTGKVRGLLCIRCNVGLGFVERHCERIFKYLEDA